MSSKSFAEDLAAWARTRLLVGRIVLLWLVMSLVLQWVTRDFFGAASLLLVLLIVQFRLWDDLADRVYDAALHPRRVLVNTPNLRGFRLVCIALALPIASMLTLKGADHLLAYAALTAAMAVLYAVDANKLPRLLRAHLVLLKYPVFIWMCAWNASTERWLPAAIGLYLALCLYEIASDTALRAGKSWRWLVAIEVCACVVLIGFPN